MSHSKDVLRREALRHRGLLDPASENIHAVQEMFFDKVSPQQSQIIAGYWPVEREFDPRPILEEALLQGFTCCLPVIQKDTKILKFAHWTETTELFRGEFGIMEPKPEGNAWLEPDIVIVPMLAFDRRGHRLGHGLGYYDATLADLRSRKTILAVGVAFAKQACLFNLPDEPHDQKLDMLITPQGTHDFRD